MANQSISRKEDDSALRLQLPGGLSEADIKRMYEMMIAVRAYDERCIKLQRAGRIGFCVTSFGEEATQIGTAAALEAHDWVFPSYRQYGVAMWRGIPMEVLADHLFGNASDLVQGRQMPAHYTFKEKRFVSISSVIGTQIIQAVGCAMASKIRKDSAIAVTYFGDGATSANDFNSGMNFAGVTKAPVLFFCVNNQYAISLPVSKQTAAETLAKKGEAYGVPGIRVDGNDVLAVYQATKEAAARARAGEGPTLIELLTYRFGPHSSSDDPSRYRSTEESERWKNRDPIKLLQEKMEAWGLWTPEYEERIWEEVRAKIQKATSDAETRPQPEWSSIFEDVYESVPASLEAQRQELLEYESGLELTNEGEFPL